MEEAFDFLLETLKFLGGDPVSAEGALRLIFKPLRDALRVKVVFDVARQRRDL